MKYRIFTNDVGPDQYSCFLVIHADSPAEAERTAKAEIGSYFDKFRRKVKILVIPDDRKDLMPDGKTGRLPK